MTTHFCFYPAMTAFTDQYSLPNIFFWFWSVINRTYKCKAGHIGGYCFQIHTQNYFKYFYNCPVNVYLRFIIPLYASTVHTYCIYIYDCFRQVQRLNAHFIASVIECLLYWLSVTCSRHDIVETKIPFCAFTH